MSEQRENYNLSDQYLSFQETRRIATNLNRIEAERERQQNPTALNFLLWLLAGIIMLPVIAVCAYELIVIASTVFEIVFDIVGAITAFLIDIWFISASWKLLTGK